MLAFACAFVIGAAPASADPYQLAPAAFRASADADLATLRGYVDGLKKSLAVIAANKALLASRASVYSPSEKQLLLSTWGSLFAFFSAIESVRQRYWGFVAVPPTDPRHGLGFLVTHTALTALLAHGLTFVSWSLGNAQLDTLFDEANPEYGVPAKAFAAFKAKAIHVSTSTQLMTGDGWAAATLPVWLKLKRIDGQAHRWALDEMKSDSTLAKRELIKNGVQLYAGNATDIAKTTAAEALFPAQKSFAEWAGDTRVARMGRPLITQKQIDELLPSLKPGDVVVSRQNWFLSNIGLPGFWPHAELYVGTPDALATLDAEPDVVRWAQAQPERAESLTALLKKRHASKWAAYATGADFQGHRPIRVIEAISEGVSFTAVEHAFGVDYLGVLRPRLKPVEKARAIERAFAAQGKPYDFDFDFYSDRALVCTELVFKAYQPSDGFTGLKLDLVQVAGRKTLPANEFIRVFAAEADGDTRQFDFVAFLDGQEKAGVATVGDIASLRGSASRLKWDIAQK